MRLNNLNQLTVKVLFKVNFTIFPGILAIILYAWKNVGEVRKKIFEICILFLIFIDSYWIKNLDKIKKIINLLIKPLDLLCVSL